MELKNKDKNNDNLEVLVDVSIRSHEDLISFPCLCLTAIILLGGIGFYQSMSEEISKHGSLRNVYNYQMELLDKAHLNGLYP